MNSYTSMYVHFVWATWDREPLIMPEMQRQLYDCIAAQCRKIGGLPIEIGGIDNHVHILARLPATVTVAQMAHDMKGGSSHLIRQNLFPGTSFRWQSSYGATSVDPEGILAVRAYIQNQPAHHAQGTLCPDWERTEDDGPSYAAKAAFVIIDPDFNPGELENP